MPKLILKANKELFDKWNDLDRYFRSVALCGRSIVQNDQETDTKKYREWYNEINGILRNAVEKYNKLLEETDDWVYDGCGNMKRWDEEDEREDRNLL